MGSYLATETEPLKKAEEIEARGKGDGDGDEDEDEDDGRVAVDRGGLAVSWRKRMALAVPHIRQRHAWDCGLACVEVVLRSNSCREPCSVDDLCARVGTQSTWTIDLAFLLQSYGVSSTLTTLTVGVNDAYRGLDFYKTDISDDEQRVNHLFADAASKGIVVREESVPLDELKLQLMAESSLYIALLDLRHVRCTDCHRRRPFFCFTYLGHFVVLCDYDPKTDLFMYRDPGSSASACFMRSADLEQARRSLGTDEDLICIPRIPDVPSKPNPSSFASSSSPPSSLCSPPRPS